MNVVIPRAKKKFSTLLRTSFFGLVMGPLTLISIYIAYGHYQNVDVLTQTNVEIQANERLYQMEHQIRVLGFALNSLAATEGMATFDTSAHQSQFVSKQLNTFVHLYPAVSGVFIMGEDEEVTSAFPFSLFALDSSAFREASTLTLARDPADVRPLLQQISRGHFLKAMPLSNNNLAVLTLRVPIQQRMPSLTRPFENTATLWAILDAEKLLGLDKKQLPAAGMSINLFVGDQNVYRVGDVDHNKAFYRAKIQGDLTADLGGVSDNLILLVDDEKSRHLEVQKKQLLNYFVVLFFLWGLAWWLISMIDRHLRVSIQDLVRETELIGAGIYDKPSHGSNIEEFDRVLSNVDRMAATIDIQMRSLKQAREQAEESERRKTDFFASVSHEIRTPLNGLLGVIAMLKRGPLTEQQQNLLNSGERAGKILSEVVNDVLDMSRVESNSFRIINLPFIPLECIENSLHSMLANIERRGLSYKVDVTPELSRTWFGDPLRITQIISNLLSNAVKFTQQGQISIEAYVEHLVDQCLMVIHIRDTGMGMSQEEIQQLFKRFWQSETGMEGHGSGLGLYICQRLVSLMQGTITVESEKGIGSDFRVTIPIARVREDSAVVADDMNDDAIHGEYITPDFYGKRVLIVEDDELNREILSFMLEATGCELFVVDDGDKVLDQVERCRPDLILLDMNMPTMQGEEVLMVLKEHDIHVPIILQSGNFFRDERETMAALGVVDIVMKPIDANALYVAMEKGFSYFEV